MTSLPDMTPQDLAEASARIMWSDDAASQRLGMALDRVAPGQATLSMTITDAMANGHGDAHGGYIFTLADSAFAFACNSYNQKVVAQHCSITYLILFTPRRRARPSAPQSMTTSWFHLNRGRATGASRFIQGLVVRTFQS